MENTISPVEVLRTAKTIAVVGASKNPDKVANSVPLYLQQHGYLIVPINPTADKILGEKTFSSLLDLPEDVARRIDVIEVFRPSDELPVVARQTIEMAQRYGRSYVFWAQLGLHNEEARDMLKQSDIPYVMDACMRIVHGMSSEK